MADKIPFATATIAQIYLAQGKIDQAESIYRDLLAADANDRQAVDGLEEIDRRREAAQANQFDDQVLLELIGEDVDCSWRISPAGRRRARRVLGGDGQLTLRLAGFPRGVGNLGIDHALGDNCGLLKLPPPPKATLAAVAVGLLAAEGRFVSIAHSKLVQLKLT